MQKITRETVEAFIRGDERKIDNSEVVCDNGCMRYLLFGNCIAKHHLETGGIEVNHRGYRTHTTKNRLRGIAKFLSSHGVDAPMVYQRDHTWYLGDRGEMPSGWVHLVTIDPDPSGPEVIEFPISAALDAGVTFTFGSGERTGEVMGEARRSEFADRYQLHEPRCEANDATFISDHRNERRGTREHDDGRADFWFDLAFVRSLKS